MEIQMDKVKLVLNVPENRTVEYNGVTFEVKPFLTMGLQAYLINTYLDAYFSKTAESPIVMSEYDYFGAEFALKNFILQANTNIDVDALDNEFYASPAFWWTVVSEIVNYDEFRETLDFIVSDIKEQKVLNSSVGAALSDLISKASKVLDGIADIKPEELEKLQKNSMELVDRIEKSSIINDVVVLEAEKKPQ
jgi:hypothetical protein